METLDKFVEKIYYQYSRIGRLDSIGVVESEDKAIEWDEAGMECQTIVYNDDSNRNAKVNTFYNSIIAGVSFEYYGNMERALVAYFRADWAARKLEWFQLSSSILERTTNFYSDQFPPGIKHKFLQGFSHLALNYSRDDQVTIMLKALSMGKYIAQQINIDPMDIPPFNESITHRSIVYQTLQPLRPSCIFTA